MYLRTMMITVIIIIIIIMILMIAAVIIIITMIMIILMTMNEDIRRPSPPRPAPLPNHPIPSTREPTSNAFAISAFYPYLPQASLLQPRLGAPNTKYRDVLKIFLSL